MPFQVQVTIKEFKRRSDLLLERRALITGLAVGLCIGLLLGHSSVPVALGGYVGVAGLIVYSHLLTRRHLREWRAERDALVKRTEETVDQGIAELEDKFVREHVVVDDVAKPLN